MVVSHLLKGLPIRPYNHETQYKRKDRKARWQSIAVARTFATNPQTTVPPDSGIYTNDREPVARRFSALFLKRSPLLSHGAAKEVKVRTEREA